jgi:hypothetical protein
MEATQIIPYQQQEKSFDLKKAVGLTLLTGAGIWAIIHFGSKAIQKGKEDKSNSGSFTPGTAKYKAKQIKMFFENDGNFGTDTPQLRTLLQKITSKEEMQQIRKEYQAQNNSVLDDDLKKELQSSEWIELSQIIAAKPEKAGQKVLGDTLYKAWAIRLKAAFDKTYSFIPGTDERAVKAVFDEIPTQRAFINVGIAYNREYKRSLMEDLKSELTSSEYATIFKLIMDKPKA